MKRTFFHCVAAALTGGCLTFHNHYSAIDMGDRPVATETSAWKLMIPVFVAGTVLGVAALWAVLKWRKNRALACQASPAEPLADSLDMARLAERGGAFDFWNEEGENISSAQGGEPL